MQVRREPLAKRLSKRLRADLGIGREKGDVIEEIGVALALLADHRLATEGAGEDIRGVVQKPLDALLAPQSRGGAHADQLLRRHFEAGAQATNQQRKIGTLGAIEGVQLIHHQVAQGLRTVVGPQRLILGAHQQVVEHLVVGEQHIRRVLAQRFLVGDHLLRPHGLRAPGIAAHEEADA